MAVTLRHAPSYGALIDVGSASVGIGLVMSSPGSTAPTLIYTHREYMRIGEHPTTNDRIRAMRHAFFSAMLHLNQEGLKDLQEYDRKARIDRILLVCGAPWSRTVTRFIHISEEEPFLITTEKIAALISKVEEEDVTAVSSIPELKDLKIRLTERAVIGAMVNGYPVEDLYGKTAREVSLAHISGLVPDDILSAADDIEKNVVHHAQRTVHTRALVTYCALRDLYPHTKDALFIDISGEATEVGLMHDHILYESRVIPWGTFTCLRNIAHELKTIPEEARTHLQGYLGGGQPENVRAAITHEAKQYTDRIREACDALAQMYVLPKNVFVMTERALEDFFVHIIRTDIEHIPKTTGGAVVIPGSNTKPPLALFSEGVREDRFLAISARFFHKLHACGEIR